MMRNTRVLGGAQAWGKPGVAEKRLFACRTPADLCVGKWEQIRPQAAALQPLGTMPVSAKK